MSFGHCHLSGVGDRLGSLRRVQSVGSCCRDSIICWHWASAEGWHHEYVLVPLYLLYNFRPVTLSHPGLGEGV